ncbi:hypothetical protein Ga0074812_105119 [Parafrankia irregularis]|uniref:Uncharacterized protein n=2 Tax=Parafrankia TaxID=2994362 RepID=A0A0S4QIX5_9ACTN|nr:hypothetical protein [Parafrankia irregularis]MBE3205631.1 hypothetical protein [Parafrankia sp. CH37]CUU55469.1 hypothetical protein Ga0074812_105119 [Parafrankia irregularis]
MHVQRYAASHVTRSRPRGRLIGAALFALTVAAFVGCSGTSGPTGPDSTAPLPTARTPQAHPASSEGLQAMCRYGGYIPAMPPYTGPAPHPIEGLQPGQNTGAVALTSILWSDPPDDLRGAFNVLTRDQSGALIPDLSRTQLVACVTRTGSSPSGIVCEDLGGNVRLLRSNYRMTVLEAHTGKVVQVTDTGTGTDDCPSFAYVDSTDPAVFTSFDGGQAYDVLRPLVLWGGVTAQPAVPGTTWTGRG